MGTRKSTVARILTLACAGLFCLGASFTWTGNGADDDWDTCGNWDACSQVFLYSGTGDDATIDGTYTVDLIDQTIDDITLSGTITFGAAESDPVLTVNTFTIESGAALTITEGATILAIGS